MIGGIAGDPLSLVGIVLEQVVDRLAPGEAAAEAPVDELIATALGKRVAQMVSGDEDPPDADEPEPGGRSAWLSHYYELLDRNSAVAAALGACDCWGQDPDCPTCEGLGWSGWACPDAPLFAAYVQPAVDAAAPFRAAPPAERRHVSDEEREEHDDAQLV